MASVTSTRLSTCRIGPLLYVVALLACVALPSFAATANFEAAKIGVKDLSTPQTITIGPGTVWYRCGLGSSKKIKFSVKSDVKLDTYIASGEEDVKKINFESTPNAVSIDNVIAKAKYSYEGGTFCDQKTSCDKSVGGRLLLYDRCLAVSNVRSSNGAPTTFTVNLQLENDNIIILIWVAIAVGIGLFILSIACCLCKALTCCCCPTPCCCC